MADDGTLVPVRGWHRNRHLELVGPVPGVILLAALLLWMERAGL